MDKETQEKMQGRIGSPEFKEMVDQKVEAAKAEFRRVIPPELLAVDGSGATFIALIQIAGEMAAERISRGFGSEDDGDDELAILLVKSATNMFIMTISDKLAERGLKTAEGEEHGT